MPNHLTDTAPLPPFREKLHIPLEVLSMTTPLPLYRLLPLPDPCIILNPFHLSFPISLFPKVDLATGHNSGNS